MKSNGSARDSWRSLLFVLQRCHLSTEEKILVDDSWKYYSYLKEPKNRWKLVRLKEMLFKYGVLFEGITCHLKRIEEENPASAEALMDIF